MRFFFLSFLSQVTSTAALLRAQSKVYQPGFTSSCKTSGARILQAVFALTNNSISTNS